MVAAIVLCGLGYAEGAALSRRLGGWQVISWALLLALPLMLPLATPDLAAVMERRRRAGLASGSPTSRSSACSSASSSGTAGLALGGIAARRTVAAAAALLRSRARRLLLHEPVGWGALVAAAAIILCVAGARRVAQDDRASALKWTWRIAKFGASENSPVEGTAAMFRTMIAVATLALFATPALAQECDFNANRQRWSQRGAPRCATPR